MTTFTAFDPRTGRPGQELFEEATLDDVRAAAARAARAFGAWRASAPGDRAEFLRKGAERLESGREALVSTADAETGLGAARLNNELDRTVAQLRAFADVVAEGSYVDAIISPPDPSAKPPRPDVRRMLVPIGPVAVFTPSNFPLAFGVAGGDTASALAAGCPVIVKGHPSHPATSEACTRALDRGGAGHRRAGRRHRPAAGAGVGRRAGARDRSRGSGDRVHGVAGCRTRDSRSRGVAAAPDSRLRRNGQPEPGLHCPGRVLVAGGRNRGRPGELDHARDRSVLHEARRRLRPFDRRRRPRVRRRDRRARRGASAGPHAQPAASRRAEGKAGADRSAAGGRGAGWGRG